MEGEAFEAAVVEVLNGLPAEFARYLEHVEVLIEDRPSHEHLRAVGLEPWHTLYGMYHGVPLTQRQTGMVLLPDTIIIFREPLVRDFSDGAALRKHIRRTVLHEIAHVFGISDNRLRELDAY